MGLVGTVFILIILVVGVLIVLDVFAPLLASIESVLGIGSSIASIFNPDNYTSQSASICCDILTKQEMASAFARDVAVVCNPSCNHTRCGGACGCQMTNTDFYNALPQAQSNAIVHTGTLNISPPIVCCDGTLSKIINGEAQ